MLNEAIAPNGNLEVSEACFSVEKIFLPQRFCLRENFIFLESHGDLGFCLIVNTFVLCSSSNGGLVFFSREVVG